MQPKRSFADNSQTAGWNDEDTHSFAQQNGAYTGCNVECETWLQNAMTCRTNKWMRWKSAVPSDLLRRAAHGLRNSTLSSSWIIWARSEILQLIMHLEMMVFDPTKTRVKCTILHQLTDGNWFVSNADQRLVMSTSFEITMQMFWNRNQNRARMKWLHEPQQLVRRHHCRDGARFAWNNIWNWELSFFSANDDTGVNLLVSLRNLHAVSSSGELYTLSRCENEFELFDRPCHSWMREQSGWTTYQIEEEERSLTNPNRWV